MTGRVAAVFCMPERSHLQRLLPVVAGLVRRGTAVSVFTDGCFRDAVERVGGRLVDLFARYPLDAADGASRPVPCRYVSFAGHYAVEVVAEVARLRPSLIVYDTFAVIGYVVGRHLGIPYVNVCAGHAMTPATATASLAGDARLAVSEAGRRAIDQLRERWGILDAAPHSYFTSLSPFLNIYCEPPRFLGPADRRAFEPIAFFGSLPPLETVRAGRAARRERPRRKAAPLRLYASCGSVVWRYYAPAALQALEAFADAVAGLDRARAVVSLGGHPVPTADRARLERPNVEVADYVDQWAVLQGASAFLTHHGLNSTHEAIYHRVPMLSYPFFADQPALARLCGELGLAISVADAPRRPLASEQVRDALARLAAEADARALALERAREWEVEVLDGRDAVIAQLVGLMKG